MEDDLKIFLEIGQYQLLDFCSALLAHFKNAPFTWGQAKGPLQWSIETKGPLQWSIETKGALQCSFETKGPLLNQRTTVQVLRNPRITALLARGNQQEANLDFEYEWLQPRVLVELKSQ